MKNKINFEKETSAKLLAGVNKLAKAVSVTFGPGGRPVALFNQMTGMKVTKDGITVANNIVLNDVVENLGAKLMREASEKSVRETGDGTTSTMILVAAWLEALNKYKYSLKHVNEVRASLERVLAKISGFKYNCDSEEMMIDVARTSTNNDENLAKLVGKAVYKVGAFSTIKLEKGDIDEFKIFDGYEIGGQSGWIDSRFVNDSKMSQKLGECFVLVIDGIIDNFEILLKPMRAAKTADVSLLVVAQDFSKSVIDASLVNIKMNNNIGLIKAENFGLERRFSLEDFAIFTDTEVYTVTEIDNAVLGLATSCVLNRFNSLITSNVSEVSLLKRINSLKYLIKETTNEANIKKLKARIQKLQAKYAVITIKDNTESNKSERFDRAEDALGAVRAAARDGVIVGGGIPLYKMSIDSNCSVISSGLKAPLVTMLKNAGLSLEELGTDWMKKPANGIEISTGEIIDYIEHGIVDPIEVTRSALRNSMEAAILIHSIGASAITTNYD